MSREKEQRYEELSYELGKLRDASVRLAENAQAVERLSSASSELAHTYLGLFAAAGDDEQVAHALRRATDKAVAGADAGERRQ